MGNVAAPRVVALGSSLVKPCTFAVKNNALLPLPRCLPQLFKLAWPLQQPKQVVSQQEHVFNSAAYFEGACKKHVVVVMALRARRSFQAVYQTRFVLELKQLAM